MTLNTSLLVQGGRARERERERQREREKDRDRERQTESNRGVVSTCPCQMPRNFQEVESSSDPKCSRGLMSD